MNQDKNIYQKIFMARKFIANQPIKKKGYNKFSDYHYYKPDQVDELALLAFDHTQMDAHFQLLKDELGVYGHLTVINLENLQEKVEYIFRTDIPSIKATNITQQYGGAVTTTKRYLLQNLLSIFDADLDFDDPHSPIAPTNPKNLKQENQPQPTLPSNAYIAALNNNEASNGNGNGNNFISELQRKRLFAIANKHRVSNEQVKILLIENGISSTNEILKSRYEEIIKKIEVL